MSEGNKSYSAPLQVLLMLGIVIATIIAGFVMNPRTDEDRQALVDTLGTKNHGVLLSPTRDIAELGLRREDGTPWEIPEGSLRWRLLIPAVEQCDEDCRQMLYITRQVHIRLNKQAHRVERAYVSLDGGIDPSLKAFLDHEHPHILALEVDRDRFEHWLDDSQLEWRPDRQVALLVDPVGRAMMFYTTEQPGTHILLDLEHLLKHSPQ
ncbi:MAG TPA: hypothetical protein VIK82_04670 [Porticoccaceae bacterium]